jgi:hypothetical protein
MSFLEARSGEKTVNLPGKREILNISKNDVWRNMTVFRTWIHRNEEVHIV